MASELSTELTSLVKWSVARLGWVLKQELGPASYHRIEKIRKRMASLRHQEIDSTKKVLSKLLVEMEQLVPEKRHEIARAFTLMLELINACENAYRTHRLKQKNIPFESGTTEKIYLVLTAHPTEARSPANIEIFHQIQTVLIHALKTGLSESQAELDSLLEIAWKTPIVRLKKPLVRDEAEHLYSIVLRHENLSVLLDLNLAYIPVLIRSWVGGDKDGHPGVNPSTLVESLQLSRQHLLGYLNAQIHEVDQWSNLFPNQDFRTCFKEFQRQTKVLAHVRENDGEQLRTLKRQFVKLDHFLGRQFHSVHKSILRIRALFEVFPGLVIPLELREDSTILTAAKKAETLAIFKMLKKVRAIAGQQDPCWYARGFIISMTQTAEHLMLANRIAKKATGGYRIPIVPLFETKKDLIEAPLVVEKIFRDAKFRKIVRSSWNDSFEVMVGYSDSAKDAGVLPSRLVISSAMLKIETVCKRHHVRVVFFQGSGGSVDRGGGPIQDQMAGWGKSAVQTYKATLQGEMVERTFAHPDIFKSQVYKIAGVCWEKNANIHGLRDIEKLSQRIKAHYQLTLSHDYFIDMIQKITPYSFLNALKIKSQPTKQTKTLLVSALRTIP